MESAMTTNPFRQYKWYLVVYASLMAVVLLVLFTDIFSTRQSGSVPQLIWLLIALVFLIAVISILAKLIKIAGLLENNTARLEGLSESLEKSRSVLGQINQSVRLSDTVRDIASRELNCQALREALFDKLQQHDFDSADRMIEELSHRAGYEQFAEQLRLEFNNYRNATDQERENQLIANIEKLFENYKWARASAQIEYLIRTYPASERVRQLRQKLTDKKEERKKVLLNLWDDAVRRQATDRSLEILQELDLYLTPNEALAFQEAARDVFRSKLHNLGVQFSLAVSGRNWARALQTGQKIVHDFPNSRMAEEIREKWDVLEQKVAQQAS